MIAPKRNKIFMLLLDLFLHFKFKSRFQAVNFIYPDTFYCTESQLIIGNHTTWWDGFICWKLNNDLLHKKFHIMMLETQLKRFWFFQKIGAFSIDPGNRSVFTSLDFASQLLQNTENMVVFYPQGVLNSIYNETFVFHKGLAHILKNNQQASLLMYAAFWDYSSTEKPYLNVYLEKIKNPSHLSTAQIENTYREFYANSKAKQILNFKP
ncbi:MAG: hypothetical protein EAZ53_12905 [Bacteroidetes bacterium]|nr:MAG: hypothetical protein EAZ53_12905 [Bacteroidota bacterium]